MKEVKELNFEELSVKQKLGMVHTALLNNNCSEEDREFVYDLIRNRALGAVWIQFTHDDADKYIEKVKELADYPILIVTDAESGMGDYLIGRQNPIACTGDEKYAYAFGKALGVTASKKGYNVICNPILDVSTTGWVRSLGSDKDVVAKMAAAEARGLHDGGVLTVGKHYPSGIDAKNIDTHMAEGYSEQTEEELIDFSLYAYKELMKEDLLDGVMTGHEKFINIDPEAPASLSKKVISIIRDLGFDGFCMTDALCMMGILAKFGNAESKALSIAAGNDLALPHDAHAKFNQEALYMGYEKGIITDERLDEAVKRVLAAQHKVMELEKTKAEVLTEEEDYLAKHVSMDSIYAKVDEGLTTSISRDGKHFFALMTRNEEKVGADGKVDVDTFSNGWLYPSKVTEKLKELFPNSTVYAFHQFPRQIHNMRILSNSIGYDDVIFITFTEAMAYMGAEHLTRRVEILIEAMQYTNRISTLVHFGNPCVLENLPHISRYILGGLSEKSVETCLEILAGEYEAKGVPTYDFKLN